MICERCNSKIKEPIQENGNYVQTKDISYSEPITLRHEVHHTDATKNINLPKGVLKDSLKEYFHPNKTVDYDLFNLHDIEPSDFKSKIKKIKYKKEDKVTSNLIVDFFVEIGNMKKEKTAIIHKSCIKKDDKKIW